MHTHIHTYIHTYVRVSLTKQTEEFGKDDDDDDYEMMTCIRKN